MPNNKNSQVIKFLKSNGFGSSFLIAIVIFEGFFAFKLFMLTGIYTFAALLPSIYNTPKAVAPIMNA